MVCYNVGGTVLSLDHKKGCDWQVERRLSFLLHLGESLLFVRTSESRLSVCGTACHCHRTKAQARGCAMRLFAVMDLAFSQTSCRDP